MTRSDSGKELGQELGTDPGADPDTSPGANPGADPGANPGEGVTLRIAQQPEADELLARSPLAALVGMLLDQQVPMEWAFTGPYTLAGRMGADDLDAAEIAAYDPDAFTALFTAKPALHRYPGSMAQRVQQLCQYLVAEYDGDAGAVWRDAGTGEELLRRLKALPGYGAQKAQIFLALLGKRFGVRPTGWRAAAGPYGEAGSHRSVADITGPESLAEVRAYKQEAKAAAKAAATAAKSAKASKASKSSNTPKE
ncbi:HhH-GPD-type base excision DNA repair protein [Streptomyces sp. cmx-18-6]|uniref:HhH-GPD-type base excision DNA repair protein n=1 Tax=Streptomyces sp. cmx-18-6 TaxID=2790930 RepID=UPI0039812BD7